MNLSTKASVFASAILLALIAARTYYTLITGYILPDEAYYLNLFVIQGLGFSDYRPILHIVYLIFFTGTASLLQLARIPDPPYPFNVGIFFALLVVLVYVIASMKK